jgi:hypothetical protein
MGDSRRIQPGIQGCVQSPAAVAGPPGSAQRQLLHLLETFLAPFSRERFRSRVRRTAAVTQPKPWVVDPNEVVEYERLTPPTRVSSLVSEEICGAQHVAAGMFKL